MVKTLEMIGFTANKSAIRSQAPTVQCTMEKVQRLNGGGWGNQNTLILSYQKEGVRGTMVPLLKI